MATDSDLIHKALRDAAVAWNFPVVTYPTGVRTTGVVTVKAKTVLAARRGTVFAEGTNRQTAARRRERQADTWDLILKFDREVSLEEFEESLQASPPVIARDLANGRTQQVTLFIEESIYETPPTQQPSSGSRAQLRFSAVFTPL